MANETNAMDDILTKMYQYLDPPRSPGIVPSPEGRRAAEDGDDDVANNDNDAPLNPSNFRIASSATRFFAVEDEDNEETTRRSLTEETTRRSLTEETTPSDGATGRGSTKWWCAQCNRSFAAQFALDQHRRFKHQGYKIHCRYCPHTTTNGYALFLHVQREHGDASRATNGYTGVNGIRAASKRASVQRKRRAYKVARHSAPSARRSNVAVAGNHNNNNVRHGNVEDVLIVGEQRRHSAEGAVDVSSHIHHSMQQQTNGAGRSDDKLSRSGRQVGKRNAAGGSAMKIVRQSGLAPLECNLCGKKFAFHSGLRMHTKMVHSGYRFTCQYCGLHFTNGYAIHRHVNIVHNVIGSVRNSCCIPTAPGGSSPEADEESVASLTAMIEESKSSAAVLDSASSLMNDEESLKNIRMRLKRKPAVPLPGSRDTRNNKSSLSQNNNDADEWSSALDRIKLPDQKFYSNSINNNNAITASSTAIPCHIRPLVFPANTTKSFKSNPHHQQFPPRSLINCLLCPYKTESVETLRIHCIKHVNNNDDAVACSSSNIAGVNFYRRNRCPYCTYVADNLSAYVVHAASHFLATTLSSPSNLHTTATTSRVASADGASSTSAMLLRCTFCDRRFSNADELDNHERKHAVRF